MKIRCMIIDDEPLARKGLREYIGDVDFLELDSEFDNALAAIERLNSSAIDLLFLDIQMPRLDGLALLRSLANPPLVVLTTAYPEYALEGYELDVLDYLVKPIAFNRFVKAAVKAKAHISQHVKTNQPADTSGETYFFIRTEGRLQRIAYDDILFAEAMENYVVIHTKEKKHIAYLTFKTMEESLPEQGFLKVHKSYIINLAKVDGIEAGSIIIGTQHIPISRSNKEEIINTILSGKLLKR